MITNERRVLHLRELHKDKADIVIGDESTLPLTVNDFLDIKNSSKFYVNTVFESNRSKFLHINVNGIDYSLILKKQTKNETNDLLWINDILNRKEIEIEREINSVPFEFIPVTIYASVVLGLVLTSWPGGEHQLYFSSEMYGDAFKNVVELELNGYLISNTHLYNYIGLEPNKVFLVDLSGMYKFDPTKEFNSRGMQTPYINGPERFESTFFFRHMIENCSKSSLDDKVSLFRVMKEQFLKANKYKLVKLFEMKADTEILQLLIANNDLVEAALKDLKYNLLQELFIAEKFRSSAVIINKAIANKYGDKITICLLDDLLVSLKENFDIIDKYSYFVVEDKDMSQEDLLSKYKSLKKEVKKYIN